MSFVDTALQSLLSRNLFLSSETKTEILTADQDTKAEILPVLNSMDRRQTHLFRKLLAVDGQFIDNMTAGGIRYACKKLNEKYGEQLASHSGKRCLIRELRRLDEIGKALI